MYETYPQLPPCIIYNIIYNESRGINYRSASPDKIKNMKKEKETVRIARHILSDTYLVNGKFVSNPTKKEIREGGQCNYADYAFIVREDEDGFDACDDRQEREEDYEIIDF